MPHQPINSVADIGEAVWAVRKVSKVRQDDAAGSAGVSHVFLRDLERGKQTVQLGLVLQVLAELGVGLTLDLPDDAARLLESRRSTLDKRRQARAAEAP